MPTVTSNGIQLYYERHGQGEPLLLIAGVGQGVLFWQHTLLPLLAAKYEVILLDNRGIGQSEMPTQPFTVEMMAADVMGLLTALNLPQVNILGHSLGAAIAFELAHSAPEKVKKLAMMSALYPGPQATPPSERAMAVLTSREGDLVTLLKNGIRIATAPGFETREPSRFAGMLKLNMERNQAPEQYLLQAQAGLQYVATDKLAEPPATFPPLLLIYGESDEVTPLANGQSIQQQLPETELKVIHAAGHLLPLEQSRATAEAVASFLQ